MKRVEVSKSFKGFSNIEALKRLNLNNNQLMFYSEPSSANGTPTAANTKKIKLEPIMKDFLSSKKPTADSPTNENPSSNKASPLFRKNVYKKASTFSREASDSDSDVGTPTGGGKPLQTHNFLIIL